MLRLGSFITFAVLAGLVIFGQAQHSFAQEPVTINKLPMRDLGVHTRERIRNNSIDLGAPFSVELTGTITKAGRISPETARYIRSEGDKEMIDLAKRAIDAVNAAGYFAYLSELSGEEFVLRVEQDASVFNASVNTGVASESRARTTASALQMMAALIRNEIESGKRPAGDDLRLIQSMTVSAKGKNVILNFKLPKAEFRQMIESSLGK
jgi:hypothetical protein